MSGWIYIGADCEKLNWCKVGKTDGDLRTRHRSAQNPNFFIYAAFKITGCSYKRYSKETLGKIEDLIHEKLCDHGDYGYGFFPIPHFSTGRNSECYNVNPETMMSYVECLLVGHFREHVNASLDGIILDNYRYPNNNWWRLGDRFDSLAGSMPTQFLQPQVLTRECDHRDRIGISPTDGYSTRSIAPPVPLGDGRYVDQFTGEEFDEDDYSDENDD